MSNIKGPQCLYQDLQIIIHIPEDMYIAKQGKFSNNEEGKQPDIFFTIGNSRQAAALGILQIF